MALDLQRWNPFKFARADNPAHPVGGSAASGAHSVERASAERASTEGAESARLLQALDPFGLLPGLFRSPFSGTANAGHWFGDFSPSLFQPRMDIVDDGDALRLTAELPGLQKQDLTLLAEDGFLVLRGEKRVDKKDEEKGCYRLERAFGSFQRIVPLPEGIDLERAEAKFEDGVLTLRLPKKAAETSTAPRKLEIR
jgi:HSP20 family protein